MALKHESSMLTRFRQARGASRHDPGWVSRRGNTLRCVSKRVWIKKNPAIGGAKIGCRTIVRHRHYPDLAGKSPPEFDSNASRASGVAATILSPPPVTTVVTDRRIITCKESANNCLCVLLQAVKVTIDKITRSALLNILTPIRSSMTVQIGFGSFP